MGVLSHGGGTRHALVLLHRWVGLATAVFLAVAGLTGTAIAFHRELDAWLNPGFFRPEPPAAGPTLPTDELVRRVEAAEPRFKVTYAPLRTVPGRAAELYGEPRLDPSTGEPFEVAFDEVFAEPTTGAIVGRRTWGACCLEREHVIPFLYRVHYSLKVPGNWGVWLMGAVAAAWTIDCFVGLWLTFPRGRPFLAKWRPAWRVKRGAGGFRLAFDLHRAAGLWLWGLLLVLAVSSVSFNLQDELFRPLVGVFSPVTPKPLDRPEGPPAVPRLSFGEAAAAAAAEARRRGWEEAPGHAFYSPGHDAYGVDFRPVHAYDRPGLGSPVLYVGGADGRILGARVPGEGTAGDVFEQLQYPLHSGQVAGLPGRVTVALAGLAVAGLSVTGVLIWARKRAGAAAGLARRTSRWRHRAAAALGLLAAGAGWVPFPSAAQDGAAGDSVELAPVTVTGEKIARPVGETTSSVVVVPAERLPPVQNRDVYDALRFAPNVVETSPGGQPIIRGLDASGGPGFGGGAAFSGARPRATVFVDGVPQLSSITRGLEPGVFDLEQVEVYRGPQSTIQGRNSLAGAIVVRTRDPTFEPEAILEGGVRTQGLTYFGGAAVSGPLVADQVAARLAVDRQEGRGFDEYTLPGLNRARWNQDDAANARAKILILPEALPAASAKLTLAHQTDQEPSTPGGVNGSDLGDGEETGANFGVTRARSDTAALELGYELAPGLRLEFLPSYVDARLNIDTPDRVLEFEETSHQWSGELRAVYDPAGGRLQGVAGIYGYHRSLEQKNPSDALSFAADDELNTAAAFGEATAMVWGPFGVLLGGRFERETQDRDFDGDFGLGLDFDVDETVEIFLPKAGLVYRPEGGRFSAALTAQRGYNAGGGAVSFRSGTPYVFDKETSWTYELSARSTHSEGRVQLAANLFYSTYEDYQVFAAGPEGPQDTITLNAPKARTYGAEFEVRARPVRSLELFGGLGLLETEFTDFEDSAQDYDGNSFPGAAPLTASVGAVADLPLGVRLAADASYVDGYNTAITNDDGDEVGDRLVVNARAEIGWRGATLFAFANNLLDEDYFLSRDTAFDAAVIGAPRTLGVGARLEF